MKRSTTASTSTALGNSAFALRDLVPLTKPTISLLVIVTAVPSLLIAVPGLPSPLVTFATLIGTFLSSSSAAVFNHLIEADIDSTMNRTRARPIPSGKVPALAGGIFGILIGVLGIFILYAFTTPLAAALAVAAHIFYSVVYTVYLKPNTVQNIVIGGAAGAIGPLIGWAAVTGTLEWPAWVMFGIIFLWTPPHFWALALKYKNDYAAANIPMMPVIKGEDLTRKYIFLYTLTLIPAAMVLGYYPGVGMFYLAISAISTGYFVWMAYRLLVQKSERSAMALFHYSCLYLFIIFGSLALDKILFQL